MPANLTTLDLFNGLKPAGGTRIAPGVKFETCDADDGDDAVDTLTVVMSCQTEAAALVAKNHAFHLFRDDGTQAEYIVASVRKNLASDKCTVACTGVRGFLTDLQPNTAVSLSGTNPTAIASAVVALAHWPTWLTVTGVGSSPSTYNIDISADDNIGDALTKMMDSFNAQVSPGSPPIVGAFVPTITSGNITGYTYTIYGSGFITYPTGTAEFQEDVNLRDLDITVSTVDPQAPDTGYVAVVDDLYRNDAATYPDQKIAPFQTGRLVSRTFGLDLSARIARVRTAYHDRIETSVDLATQVRKIAHTVSSVSGAVAPIAAAASTGWTDADIAANAGIKYGKLDLAGDVQSSDLAAGIALNKLSPVTASHALVSDGSGFVTASSTTATELGYVAGVTSAVQTQLSAKITGGAGAIVNADINAAAGIDYSKLALTGHLVAADFAGTFPTGLISTFEATSTAAGLIALTWHAPFIPASGYFKLFHRSFPNNSPGAAWVAYSGNNISNGVTSENFVLSSEGYGSTTECAWNAGGAVEHETFFRLELYDVSNTLQASADASTGYYSTPL